MFKKMQGRLLSAASLTLLAVATPVCAEPAAPVPPTPAGPGNGLLSQFYINVPITWSNGQLVTQKYLYNPAIGAYTLGPDPNLTGLNAGQILNHNALLPKPDPFFSNPIPYTSGPVLPTDMNRNLIGGFKRPPGQPETYQPRFSVPNEKMCSAVLQNAWTFSSDVIAPEVEVFSVRLPHQKLATEAFVIGAVKRKFPIVVSSAFGQICIKDGAKALVCKSFDSLHLFNLTGGKDSVFLRFPEGKSVAIGPGSELIVARSRDRLTSLPADGIGRRAASGVFSVGEYLVAVNEFSIASVLQTTGLSHALATVDSTAEKRLCHSALKTAAVLTVTRGADGYKGGPENGKSTLVEKPKVEEPVAAPAVGSTKK